MDADQQDKWLSNVRGKSLVRTPSQMGKEAEHFLTLSTCSYEYENARFVVVGALKKIY